jgi:hypothetical protein
MWVTPEPRGTMVGGRGPEWRRWVGGCRRPWVGGSLASLLLLRFPSLFFFRRLNLVFFFFYTSFLQFFFLF